MRTFNSNSNTLNQDLLKILKDTHSGIIFTKGIPGSGKTTWAKEFVSANSNLVTRINKDDFRAMLSLGKFSSAKEDLMNSLRIQAIKTNLFAGKWLVLDDTHLTSGSFAKYKELTQNVICVDFTNVSVEECIKRDVGRTNAVGKDVILKLWESSLTGFSQDKSCPPCFIFDVDGTVANNKSNNRHFDPTRYLEDTPREGALAVLKSLTKDFKIFIFSGREGTEEGKENTITWLKNQGVDMSKVTLAMRSKGDFRKDSEIKKELFTTYIVGQYNCLGVFDDRFQVACLWRELGLELFKCGPLFDFDLSGY